MNRVGWSLAGRLLLAMLGCAWGVGCVVTQRDRDGEAPDGDAAPTAAAGFVDLDAREYRLGNRTLSSSSARLFYGLTPAQFPEPDPPLFVLGAGGPGAAVLPLLAALGPCRLVVGGSSPCSAAPSNVTELGHVLAIDARNAGFSYDTLAEPGEVGQRTATFSIANYNVFVDAAATGWVLTTVLEQHPELGRGPIYFVAESYGAERAVVLVDLIARFDAYRAGRQSLDDPTLLAELDALRSRLGGLILLQPLIAGSAQARVTGALYEQPGSILDEIAAETGGTYERCDPAQTDCRPFDNALNFLAAVNRSADDRRATPGEVAERAAVLREAATTPQSLTTAIGITEGELDAVLGGSRSGAFRFGRLSPTVTVDDGELAARYGATEAWDARFVPLNGDAQAAFYGADATAAEMDPNQDRYRTLFLDAIRHVPTLVTRATNDLRVYGPAVAPVLGEATSVANARIDESTAIPRLRVEFADATVAEIWTPEYESSHAVALDAPDELLRDLSEFVGATSE